MKNVLERVVCTCDNLKMDGWRSLPMTQSDLSSEREWLELLIISIQNFNGTEVYYKIVARG